MSKLVIVSDIHGCYEEFIKLVTKCKFDFKKDELIACGDLVEKGPKSELVVSWFRTAEKNGYNIHAIAGNHDESMVRFWKHEVKVSEGRQSKNPMKAHEDRVRTYEQLSRESLRYLDNLPHYLERDFGGRKYIFIHGGMFPNKHPRDMDFKVLCRLRYLKRNGDKLKMIQAGKEEPGDPFWAELYDGRHGFAFYGHQQNSGQFIHWDHAVGIDLGACYGHGMGAVILDKETGKMEFVGYPTNKYADIWNGE